MDGRPRQDPAYRPTTEGGRKAPFGVPGAVSGLLARQAPVAGPRWCPEATSDAGGLSDSPCEGLLMFHPTMPNSVTTVIGAGDPRGEIPGANPGQMVG